MWTPYIYLMPTSNWGPATWRALHASCAAIKRDDPAAIARLWYAWVSLLSELPCPVCSAHAQKYLRSIPRAPSSKFEINAWFWRFHNHVNARLGKQYVSPERAQAAVAAGPPLHHIFVDFCARYMIRSVGRNMLHTQSRRGKLTTLIRTMSSDRHLFR